MGDRPPSPYQLEQAMSALLQTRQRLLEIDPEIENDEALYLDSLDGEGGDALQVIERLIDASLEADALAAGAKARKMDLSERQARFEKRRDTLRAIAFAALDALALRKLERAAWTASIRPGQPAVQITDAALLLPAFQRIRSEPDKQAIGEALKAGQTVEGAELSNGAPSLSVRVR